jgi:AcrR family transcriptional regulator
VKTKLALLEAATTAFAQSGIAASTAVIARNAGVAEGTLFRYFATKDDLINELYLFKARSLSVDDGKSGSLSDRCQNHDSLYLEQLH